MPLFGHMFISEALKRPVFDSKGDVAGRCPRFLPVRFPAFMVSRVTHPVLRVTIDTASVGAVLVVSPTRL